MKIHPVGAELFHVDRRWDGHDEANSLFSQFCECAWKTLAGMHWAFKPFCQKLDLGSVNNK